MILSDLKCGQDHVFEAWFKDGAAYETQRKRREIACPGCGDTKIAKAPMAPRVTKSRGQARGDDGRADTHADKAAEMAANARIALGALRRQVEENCDNVGSGFAEEARKIHYGEAEKRGIYGEATESESRELDDEGVQHQRIPWIERQDS